MPRPLVLIADDEPTSLASIEKFLHLEGFDCVRATNGTEAVGVLAARPLSAALLDCGLEAPDALEITRHARTQPATQALPMLLFAEDEDDESAAFDAGASAVIFKPFHLAAIAARLRELVPGVAPPSG